MVILIPIEIKHHNWPTAKATIVNFQYEEECNPPDSGKCVPVGTIEYEYIIKTTTESEVKYLNSEKYDPQPFQSYESKRLSVLDYIDKYPIGKNITIYYDRDNPKNSSIRPYLTINEWLCIIFITFGYFFSVRFQKFSDEKHYLIKYDLSIIAKNGIFFGICIGAGVILYRILF